MSRYVAGKQLRDGFEVIELYDADCKGKATVVPQIGCNVISYECGGHQVLLPPADLRSFMNDAAAHTKYGVPLLFPPNRVKNGTFTYNDRLYELPINEPPDHHLHGEISKKAWDVVEYGATEERGAFLTCRFDYGQHPEIMAYFPHELVFIVTHTLREGRLNLEIKITHKGRDKAPFALGLHPYFAIPADSGQSNLLTVPASQEWPVTNQAFVTGKPLMTTFSESLSNGIDLAEYPPLGCSLVSLREGETECRIEYKEFGYRVHYHVDPSFSFIVLFKPDWASAFSLEPYTYVTDAFNLPYDHQLTGARGIAPGEELTFCTSIWVEWI
jgi:aldose 1-epimerase